MHVILNKAWRLLRKILLVASWLLQFTVACMLILSFTNAPFWGLYELSRPGADYTSHPEVIVLMGGGGMPGKAALMRSYYTAAMAAQYPMAEVIIALPDDTGTVHNHLSRISDELHMRGVERSRIRFAPEGTNTRAQAVEIMGMQDVEPSQTLLIVTDPEHVYRAVKSFEKLGFHEVGSMACWEHDLGTSLAFSAKNLGGKAYVPDVGSSGQLRYQFWNHLIYQILLLREYVAIAYYKLQGWI